MAKTKISEFNANPALNTDIDSINIAEGCSPSGINDAIRELMSQLKDWQSGTSNDPMVIGSTGSLTLNQGTANGVAYLNGSKVVTSGSALTFDGTALRVTGSTGLYFSGSTAGHAYMATDATSTADSLYIATNTNIPILFQINATEQMRLTSTGLGIGTSSPAAKLHVVGNTRITADIESTGNSIIYSSNGSAAGTINAGIYLVGSDSSARFYTGNSERARIDSSGNLGLGVTPSAWGTAKAFQIGGSGFAISSNGSGSGDGSVTWNGYYNGTNWIYSYTGGVATRYRQNESGHAWFYAPSGTAGNAITFTQAMTLDASGNLGVGTTSPSRRLSVYSTNSIPARFETNTSDTKIEILTTSGTQFIQGSANNLLFGTNNTEAARIDSSGNLLVGTTSATGTPTVGFCLLKDFSAGSASGLAIGHQSGTGGGAVYAQFAYNGSAIGSITQSGTTAVLYNTTSDQRLKENIQNADSASAIIDALQVRKFDWKSDNSHQRYGFVAQELATVAPEAVYQPEDASEMMAVDYSKLVPMLVKEIQSLRKRLADAGL